MNLPLRSLAAIIGASLGMFIAHPAQADVPGPHPEYVHALNDLRYAHALLRFPAEWNVTEHEPFAPRSPGPRGNGAATGPSGHQRLGIRSVRPRPARGGARSALGSDERLLICRRRPRRR